MSSLQLSVRYAAFYTAIFTALGVYLPFWPLWLGGRGLSATEIATLLALASWVKIATSPGFAQISDRSGRAKTTLLAAGSLSAVGFAALFFAETFWAILLFNLAAIASLHALLPLGDSQTMAAVYRRKLDYGRIRLWGSIGFIAAAAGAGPLIESHGSELVLPLMLVLVLATVLVVAALPKVEPQTQPSGRGAWRPLLQPRFLVFLVCASLLQASHATYYAFSTLHWQAAGHSETVIGLLWAEGVIAEIVLFAVSGTLTARFRPSSLLLLAGLCGIIRWTVIGETTWLPALVAAQLLHAATFGATHLGAMHFIARRAPGGSAATAQSLYAAISGGLAMGLALLLAGALYSESPALAFLAMAGLAAVAVIMALRLRSYPAATEARVGEETAA